MVMITINDDDGDDDDNDDDDDDDHHDNDNNSDNDMDDKDQRGNTFDKLRTRCRIECDNAHETNETLFSVFAYPN